MKQFGVALLLISIVINIIVLSYIFTPKDQKMKDTNSTLRKTFSLISPRVFIENPNDILINFMNLRTALRTYSSTVKEPHGIYFEYLPSGVSIGINEKESFIVASLLKVPLVMSVFKKIEDHKIKLSDLVTIEEQHLDPYFGTLWKKGAGTKLSIEELMRHAIIFSDNTAQKTLYSTLSDKDVEDVYDSLDIPKELDGTQPVVSSKNYSSILRSLYLSSYLQEENSQNLLQSLTQTPFSDKIVAGVPVNITVAHKIGVHLGGLVHSEIYSDCAIVYVPNRPYILCIMMKSDEPTAQTTMKNISRIIYEYISNAKK